MIRDRGKVGFKIFSFPRQKRFGLNRLKICIERKLVQVGSKNTMHTSYVYVCHSHLFLLLQGLR